MPYYIGYPKNDPIFENYPFSSALRGVLYRQFLRSKYILVWVKEDLKLPQTRLVLSIAISM